MNEKAKVITSAAIKGGVGKTTISFNVGCYLARQGKKVLLIDLDHQASMTSNYHFNDTQKVMSDMTEIFADAYDTSIKDTKIRPMKIDENLYGLSTSDSLDKSGNLFMGMNSGVFVLHRYLNFIGAKDDYDYIIIDTHPDFNLATENAIVCADILLIPIQGSSYSFDSILKMQSKYNELQKSIIDINGNSYVNAQIIYFGNLVEFNTASSHQFIKDMQETDGFVGYLHKREAFVSSEKKYFVLDYLNNKMESASKKNTKSAEKEYTRASKAYTEISSQLDNLCKAFQQLG